jgi:hypothetical protein
MILEGDLQALQSDQNRPVDVWGSLDHINQDGNPVIKVDRYELPFPDAQFQVLRGTQKIVQLAGQPATLFTTDAGATYIQQMPGGTIDQSEVGREGDPVLIQALVIPTESLVGYPAALMFGAEMALNPKSGQPAGLEITADQPYVMDKPQTTQTSVTNPPTATIEQVELVYFASNPRYTTDPNAGYPYLQPAWRFYGHFSNGDEFEVLIQALNDEYLLPGLAPSIPPG